MRRRIVLTERTTDSYIVVMGETKVISLRIDSELLAFVDAEAERRRWSRNATIHACVEFGLPDLEKERGSAVLRQEPVFAPKEDRQVERVESQPNSAGGKPHGGNRAASVRKVGSGRAGDDSGDGVGEKCPHGYMNWMVCRNAGGDCGK